MNIHLINKVLANPTRLNILSWLKSPKAAFPRSCEEADAIGVCCGLIQEKAGLSQSTISNYLAMLEGSGLLIATRRKQWTYYKRNEKVVRAYLKALEKLL